MPSVYEDILDACVVRVQALSLAGIDNANIVRKPLSETREVLEGLPGVRIAPSEIPEKSKRASFEAQRFKEYYVDIVLIIAYNSALFTSLDYLGLRGQMVAAFEPLGSGLPSVVWKTEILHGKPINRKDLNKAYHYSEITVAFYTLE